jgi:hypothetical protein
MEPNLKPIQYSSSRFFRIALFFNCPEGNTQRLAFRRRTKEARNGSSGQSGCLAKEPGGFSDFIYDATALYLCLDGPR